MKNSSGKRTYHMTARAEQVARNEARIMQAVVDLWKQGPIGSITLEQVAERSGVTVRTILRKYGSRDGLLEACIEADAAQNQQVRDKAPPGDIRACLEVLLRDYEEIGDAAIRTLAVEEELPIAKKLLDSGRAYHRSWCARVFDSYLPDFTDARYETRLLAFITATEFYLWKLLRRDLNYSREQTIEVFQLLVEGLVQKFKD